MQVPILELPSIDAYHEAKQLGLVVRRASASEDVQVHGEICLPPNRRSAGGSHGTGPVGKWRSTLTMISRWNCRTIYLLSCVGQKQAAPIHARDLYTSTWFCKARTYADETGQPWFILSAQYGLVHPDEMIAPYDLTLNSMPVADRRRWASRVLTQLEQHLNGIRSVTFLAGRRYREFLEPSLRSRGLVVSIPMEGLRIGEQLSWLTREIHD